MISDVLSKAITDIDRCLYEDEGLYSGDMRGRILTVRDEMESLKGELEMVSRG